MWHIVALRLGIQAHPWRVIVLETGEGSMFTGIIEAVGEIKHVAPLEKGISLSITCGMLDLSDTKSAIVSR